ncbi:MAG: hypothetical protein IJU37_07355 [Desulfovibrio sp.]|nr:hypothetical protein [Desulfovibrio sp.]
MKHLCIACSWIMLSLLVACGPSNNIRLLPPTPPKTVVIPSPNAPRVTVVAFQDKRQDQSIIGIRRDKSAFVTSDNVSHWFSKVLAEELARHGLQVALALSVDEARKANPDYLVTGHITEAMLKESSAMEMTASLGVSYTLANRLKRLVQESPSNAQTRTSLPSGDVGDKLLLETLQGLTKSMAQKIIQAIFPKK